MDDNKIDSFSLPMKVPNEIMVEKLFSGKFIAIYKGEIIAAETTLKRLHEKCDKLVSAGEGCLIDFIEESAGIYGFEV